MDISGCEIILVVVFILALSGWFLCFRLALKQSLNSETRGQPYQDEKPSAAYMVVTVMAGCNIPAESPVVIGNDGMAYTPGQVPNHGTYRIIGIATNDAREGEGVDVRLI